jgi:hypothetical protein
MKNAGIIFALAVILAGCGQNQNQNTDQEQTAVEITIHDLLSTPDQYVDKTVLISGTIDHVCRHGGKKMFMIGENPDDRIKITPDEKIGVFEVDLEGGDYTVKGFFKELVVDENYIAMLEEEEARAAAGEGGQGHDSPLDQGLHEGENEGENAEEGQAKPESQVLREQLAASGKDHLSFYSVECIALEEKKSL